MCVTNGAGGGGGGGDADKLVGEMYSPLYQRPVNHEGQ